MRRTTPRWAAAAAVALLFVVPCLVASCGNSSRSGIDRVSTDGGDASSSAPADADGAVLDASAGGNDAGASSDATDDLTASSSDGTDEPTASSADSGGSPLDATPDEPTDPCGAVVESHPIEGATHVAVCSHVTYLTKPPSSGNHYPIWAAYRTYASAVPEGFWVHDLEHGAVVLSYNCPGGCAADVSAAQTWIDGLAADPLCDPDAGDPRIRVVMTPDPNLDVTFAASAWGWTLRAHCFDPVAFGAFYQAHFGQGPEVLCAQGEDLSLGVHDGCGE